MTKSLNWYLKRHSLLYKIRFKMVSKKTTFDRIDHFCYNVLNPKKNIPSLYFQINQMILSNTEKALSDFEKAQKIAKWLKNNVKGGPGLGKSSEKVLLKMIKGEGGVCSDFSQVFNNFCVINNLKVKEWGIKITNGVPSIVGGHSFNEIYSKELQKWILIDVSKSIYFYHTNPKLPLSASELFDFKKNNKEINHFVFNKKTQPDIKRIEELYLAPNVSPFVITNYCNKTYDYFLNKFYFFPIFIIHGLIFLSGKSYAFEFPQKIEQQFLVLQTDK